MQAPVPDPIRNIEWARQIVAQQERDAKEHLYVTEVSEKYLQSLAAPNATERRFVQQNEADQQLITNLKVQTEKVNDTALRALIAFGIFGLLLTTTLVASRAIPADSFQTGMNYASTGWMIGLLAGGFAAVFICEMGNRRTEEEKKATQQRIDQRDMNVRQYRYGVNAFLEGPEAKDLRDIVNKMLKNNNVAIVPNNLYTLAHRAKAYAEARRELANHARLLPTVLNEIRKFEALPAPSEEHQHAYLICQITRIELERLIPQARLNLKKLADLQPREAI